MLNCSVCDTSVSTRLEQLCLLKCLYMYAWHLHSLGNKYSNIILRVYNLPQNVMVYGQIILYAK